MAAGNLTTREVRPPPLPRTNRTSLVPPLVLSGHAASLSLSARSPARPSTAVQNSLAPLPSAAPPRIPLRISPPPEHTNAAPTPPPGCAGVRAAAVGGSARAALQAAAWRPRCALPPARALRRGDLCGPRALRPDALPPARYKLDAHLSPAPYKPDAHLSPARTNPTRISPRASSRAVPLPPHRGPVCTEA